jgi:hypothetical protein
VSRSNATGRLGPPLLALVLAWSPAARSADLEHCLTANAPVADDVRVVRITTTTGKGEPAQLQLQTFGRRSKGARRILVRFADPGELDDSYFLIVDDGPTTRYYVNSPELGAARRVPGEKIGRNLFGTDFAWEDVLLAQGLLEWQGAVQLREETVAGRPTWVLELEPEPEASSYARIVAWIDHEHCLPLKADMYRGGKRVRSLQTEARSVIRIGNRAIPHEITIHDVGKGTSSTAVIQAVVPGLRIPDEILSVEGLGRYRPRIVLDGADHRPEIELGAVASAP